MHHVKVSHRVLTTPANLPIHARIHLSFQPGARLDRNSSLAVAYKFFQIAMLGFYSLSELIS